MTEVDNQRRNAIKIAAAAGLGITVAGFLPSKWTKPIVKMGVLPAHAQGSTVTIEVDYEIGCWIYVYSAQITPAPAVGTVVNFTASGVDNSSTPVVLTPASGSGTTDATGYVEFTPDELGFNSAIYDYPVVFTIQVDVASGGSRTITEFLTTEPPC